MVVLVRKSLFLLMITLPSFLFSLTENGLTIFVRFYEKKIYYVNKTEEIKIKVNIVNNSQQPYQFRMADDKIFNLNFEVFTQANIPLKYSEQFIIKSRTHQYVLYKDVLLKQGEEYGFIIFLDDYILLDRPGQFTVRALFNPDLPPKVRYPVITSNELSLNINPPLPPEFEGLVEVESGEVLKAEAIPPDEVVDFTIKARQRNQWDKFLLYLNLESLLLRNPDWRIKYDKRGEEGRLELIEEYKEYLKLEIVDQDILVIPTDFEIQTTNYTANEGWVQVLLKFDYTDYIALKLYTYHLERKDRNWKITNYEVLNRGTQGK